MSNDLLLKRIKESAASGNVKETVNLFSLLNESSLSAPMLKSLDNIIKKNAGALEGAAEKGDITKIKIAILGNSTLEMLASAVRSTLLIKGFLAEVYKCGYGLMEQDIIDAGSRFYAFKPDITLIAAGYRDIKEFPLPHTELAGVENMAAGCVDMYKTLWDMISSRTSCHIIQNNFDVPIVRPFGELEAKYPWTETNFIRRLNLKLGEEALAIAKEVSILDVEHLSSTLGKACWFDERFYHHSKHAFSFECVPEYATLFAAMVSAVKGRSKKCLVLDLDNTLWGGTIGDDGIENIIFGEGSAMGEAYLDFARYINKLKEKGVILAVSSKNYPDVAREPFMKMSQMPLKLGDFAVFTANWSDKATNIRNIAEELNIGLDSLVFVDNDPVERKLVKDLLPMVTVVELPEDPSLYKRALYKGHYFESTGISEEDMKRSGHYHAKRAFDHEKNNFANVDSFLASLDMEGVISDFKKEDVLRITQLINKTNQFNLTTKRYTESDVRRFMLDGECLSLSAKLKDRFTDYGLISVFIGFFKDSALTIDTWLMSCRVFSRGMEHFLFSHVVEACKRKGISEVKGLYVPSKKNRIAGELYKSLGFSLVETRSDGTTAWKLELAGSYPFIKTHVKQEAAN